MKRLVIALLFFVTGITFSIAQVNFDLALKKYQEGNFKEALYWLDKSVDKEPDNYFNSLTLRGL